MTTFAFQMFRGRTRRDKAGWRGRPAIEALVEEYTPAARPIEDGSGDWIACLPYGRSAGYYSTEGEAVDAAIRMLAAEGWRLSRQDAAADAAADQAARLAKKAPHNRVNP